MSAQMDGGARGMREGGAQSKHSTNENRARTLQDLYLHGRAQAMRCGQWGETLRTAAVLFFAAEADAAFRSAFSFFRRAASFCFFLFAASFLPILAYR